MTHHADHQADDLHAGHDTKALSSMAASATLHCLTGCAIGEIAGLVLGTAYGLGNSGTIAVSIGLAFVFGYGLSTLPLIKAGVGFAGALRVVLAADTLSILTMEVVDNLVVAGIPGAMNAGLVNATFWLSMMLSLTAAFLAAFPVNRYLLARGKGHALTHGYHQSEKAPQGAARFIPSVSAPALAAAIIAFMLGGLLVSLADDLGTTDSPQSRGE